MFKPLPTEVHQALTVSLLAAWMDKKPAIPDHEALAHRVAPARLHSTRQLRRYQWREGMGGGKTVP